MLAAALGPLPSFPLQRKRKRCQQERVGAAILQQTGISLLGSNPGWGAFPWQGIFSFSHQPPLLIFGQHQHSGVPGPSLLPERAREGSRQAGFCPSPTHPPLGKQGASLESLTRCLHQRQEHNSPLTIITGLRQLCWCAGLGLSGSERCCLSTRKNGT